MLPVAYHPSHAARHIDDSVLRLFRAMASHCLIIIIIIDLLNDFLDSWDAGRTADLIAKTNRRDPKAFETEAGAARRLQEAYMACRSGLWPVRHGCAKSPHCCKLPLASFTTRAAGAVPIPAAMQRPGTGAFAPSPCRTAP
ncbi:hypothetical protein [Pannonibacter indicus]|uniref:hypothetical protein n=1 Tax=Pannonibacter indicus TaxID=466044 RepID=UPI00391ADFBC